MKQTLTLVLAMAILLTGCKTAKQPSPPDIPVVPIETNTETKIVHIETIDTVLVEIPAQSAERTTSDKTSHLETDYAVSDARINEDGTLSHTLTNKPGKKPVPVKNEKDSVLNNTTAEKPVPVQVPIEVERELTTWEKTRLKTWGWLAAAFALSTGWIFRKKIFNLARRFI